MMVYVLERGCGHLRSMLDGVDKVRKHFDHASASDSQVQRELNGSEGRRYQHVLDAATLAWMRLAAVEDHLRAMAILIEDMTSVYTVHSAARTAAEISARAWWLLDPEITAEGRAERGFAERLYSYNEAKGLGPGALAWAESRRQELSSAADAESMAVQPANRRPKSATELVGAAFAEEFDDTLGETAYRLLSAFTHGTSFALGQLLEAVPDAPDRDLPGIVTAQVRNTANREAIVLALGVLPYRQAVFRQFRYYGWPTRRLLVDGQRAADELLRIMRPDVK